MEHATCINGCQREATYIFTYTANNRRIYLCMECAFKQIKDGETVLIESVIASRTKGAFKENTGGVENGDHVSDSQ